MDDRLHRAAQDGYLAPLKKATKKDLNYPDEEGMTPTLWAAYNGQMNALQTCCSRGGDPNRCDFTGNTALHFAARKGHVNCLQFLISFGVNLWNMDNDYHTALDISGLRNDKNCMRLLDEVIEKQLKTDKKKVEKLQKKAHDEAEQRIKRYEKMLQKLNDSQGMKEPRSNSKLKDNSAHYSTVTQPTKPNKPSIIDTIRFKSRLKKKDQSVSSFPGGSRTTMVDGGIRTVSSLPGVPSSNSSNVIYKPSDTMRTSEPIGQPKRSQLPSWMTNGNGTLSSMTGIGTGLRWNAGTGSLPGFEHNSGSNEYDDDDDLSYYNPDNPITDIRGFASIGSAGSLAYRNGIHHYDDDVFDGHSSLDTFLASLNLSEYAASFKKEKMDMDSLMMCTNEDLISLHVELGPRKKILNALEERKKSQEDKPPLEDTKF